MRNPIAALLAWLLSVLAPGPGKRRFGALSAASSVRRTEEACSVGAPAGQGLGGRLRPARGWAARPRSPYGLGGRLDGEDTALVRPYLVEHERQEHAARQRLRRLSLVMAADFGIDLDTRDVHGMGVSW
ncbi:hypothetical protein GTW37_15995 [Streptomyces sp. SID4931]|nr:hypothetical protein [Streptomyces sp. SID4931]SCF88537.1 hypothetical protein GA0115255_109987 [Streptomyces sp. Ncost-T6T-2b]